MGVAALCQREMGDSAQRASEPRVFGDERLDKAAARFVDRLEGNYRRQTEWTLEEWLTWQDDELGIRTFEALEPVHVRRWAAHLAGQDDLAASSARAYYARVRSFLTWCVGEELLDTNPAATNQATAELPDESGAEQRQYWNAEARDRLLAFVDERAHDALEDDEDARRRAFRDRALVVMLAESGVRGAEIARVPEDDRRDGITWSDVDFDGRTVRVLGKSREYEDAPLPGRVADALDRYKRVLEPPNEEWPVFPTRHGQTLKDALEAQAPEALEADGLVRDRVREYDVIPPAITVSGVRDLMERLCEAAGVKIDGEYLKPHGGRRGVGDRLYREQAELSQAALRHKSIETTHESYADIQAGEIAEDMDQVFDGE